MTEQLGGEAPLVTHLLELRSRVIRALIGVGLVAIPFIIFAQPMFALVAEPLKALMPAGTSLIATGVTTPFFTPLKLALMMAVVVAMPWLLYQLWGFVAPGLYQSERSLAAPLIVSSTLLFYLGMAFAYFVVFPLVFAFIINFAPDGVSVMTDINEYLNFIIKMFMAFGAAFETPVAIVLMVKTGFTTPGALRQKRPYVLVGMFVIGMLLTPPDMFSQLLLALPGYALFEIGILVSQWIVPGSKDVDAQREAGPPE